MNKIDKLTKKDSVLLRELITNIRLKDKKLYIKKLAKSDLYQVNNRIFKIILHYDALGSVIIDCIRSKNM